MMTLIGEYLWLVTCFTALQSSTAVDPPKPKNPNHNYTIPNTVYRLSSRLPENTFVDTVDGTLKNLNIQFTYKNGSNISADSWIQYIDTALSFYIFTTRRTIDNAPKDGYQYTMTATDSDNHVGKIAKNFFMDTNKRLNSLYKMRLLLTSTLSTIYASNDVQILFYLQSDKLFPYAKEHQQGIENINEFVTEELSIKKKSTGVTDMNLLFTSKLFLTFTCNIQDIINIRSKTRGAYKTGYQNTFKSEFEYVSQSEQFEGACGYLSGDKPVLGEDVFKTASIKFGEYFTVAIPKGVFKAPSTGTTMEISVELRSSTGETLLPTTWINTEGNKLSSGVQLIGYIPYVIAQSQQTFNFQLVARTPLLEELSSQLVVSVDPLQALTLNYLVSFVSNGVQQTNYIVFIKSFLSTMATYLSISESEILVYSYTSNQSATIIQWTIKEFSKQGFSDIVKLGTVSSKLTQPPEQPNAELSQKTLQIGFLLSRVTIKSGATFLKPVKVKHYGAEFKWETFFEYVIPIDAYMDARDGTNLNFSIITTDSPFASNNWLTVDNSTRTIRGVPIVDQIKYNILYSFTLRVINSFGNFIDDQFYIRSKKHVPGFSYSFRIAFTFGALETSIARIMYDFMSTLMTYFGTSNRNDTIVLEVIAIPSTRTVFVKYFNTSFKVTPCDTMAIIKANMKLFSGRDPNPDLRTAMKPEFIITEITTDSIESCTRNIPPHVHERDKFNEEMGPHSIKWGSVFLKTLSPNFFKDEEDGSTRNLKITFRSLQSNSPLPLTSWIFYNESTFTTYAVPLQKTFYNLGLKNELKYVLRAEDSGGRSVSTEYIVLPTGTATDLYNVTISIDLFGVAQISYAQQLVVIIKTLEVILGSDYKNNICVKSYDVTMITGHDGTSVLKWTRCDIPTNKCNFEIINDIRSKIYTQNSNTINSALSVKFHTFQIVGVVDLGLGPCALSPPDIKNQIPQQIITFCGLYTYQIAKDAFIDKEDGNTRNLQLSLKQEGKSNLESWIEFNVKSQTISMLLTKTMDTVSLERTKTLILTARDASKLERSQKITVIIQGSAIPIDYKYILRFRPSVNFKIFGKNTFMEIARKVSNYFNDDGKSFEAIQSAKTSTGVSVYEFGNCAIKYSPCDAVAMQNYRTKINEPSFKTIFPPNFLLTTTSESIVGPCASDLPPTVDEPWGPIIVDITKTYVLTVPQSTFKDKEQGNTRHLDLQLTNLTEHQLGKASWVQFDSGNQTITIVATEQIAKSLQPSAMWKLMIMAFDVKRQVAKMIFEIQIMTPSSKASHYVSMSFTVISLPLQTANFTTIFGQLRTSIIKYFKGDINIGIVSYTLASNNLESAMQVIWTNTTISKINCEKQKIEYMTSQLFLSGDIINPSFKSALSDFNLLDVKLYYDGICKDRLVPPTVVNPILPLKTTYCGYISYTIPENTFKDGIDGNTRQLQLDLKYPNGTLVILDDSFITFDNKKQKLMAIPVSNYFSTIATPITLKLTATTKRDLSVSTSIQLSIQGDLPEYSFYFQLTAEWRGLTRTALTVILQELLEKTSKYFGYTDHDINLIDAAKSSPSSNLFSVKVAICKLKYKPCDQKNIEEVIAKITNGQKTGVSTKYQEALSPLILVLSINTHLTGPCKESNRPPSLSKTLPNVTLNTCSVFEYKLDPDTFIDVEDGTNLSYVVFSINGKPMNKETTWISPTTTNRNIIAVINNNVVSEAKHYQIIVRAYDSDNLFAQTSWNIQIIGEKRKAYYQFVIQLTPKQNANDRLTDIYIITRLINGFFGDKNDTNFISISYKTNGDITYTWSSCSIPEFCDSNVAANYYNQINVQHFKMVLDTLYKVNSLQMVTDPNCQGTINPPTSSRSTWNLEIHTCGGRTIIVPTDMFADTEDGDTRNLKLSFQPSSGDLPQWISFEEKTQTIFAFPTYSEATAFKALRSVFILKATDKSGLSASVSVSLKLSIPAEAKYKYTFQYKISKSLGRVQELLQFSSRLAAFLKATTEQVSFYNYQLVSGAEDTTRQITYANCSISYTPCDLAALSALKDVFIDGQNFPKTDFQTAMTPILIQFGTTDSQCIDTLIPPRVINKISTVFISYCNGYYEFQIPENTFYDSQDGNTRQLQLTVTTTEGKKLSSDESFVQFDISKQMLYLYPIVYATSTTTSITSKYIFTLTAMDSSKLIANTPIHIELQGPGKILSDCQIQVDFSTIKTNLNLVERLRYLNTKLRQFFLLQPNEQIAMIRYEGSSLSVFRFKLYWSYCSALYTQQSTEVDYRNFISNILQRLFKPDRKTIVGSFYSAFGAEYTVRAVQTQFSGKCTNLPPIVPRNTPDIRMTISSCGYSQVTVANMQFYDFEQGNTENLELTMLTLSGEEVTLEDWVNVDKPTRSIIAVCNDFVRNTSTKVFQFYLRASDVEGQFAEVNVIITKKRYTELNIAPFDVTFEMEYIGSLNRPFVYQIRYLTQSIGSYYDVSGSSDVFIKDYRVAPGFPEYRTLTWTVCTSRLCTGSGVLAKTKDLYKAQGVLKPTFLNLFVTNFNVKRTFYTSNKCSDVIDPPFTQITITPLKPEFCSVFSYTIPSNTFLDTTERDIKKLKLSLVYQNSTQLQPSSMIQLNPVTLQIYGVNVQFYSNREIRYKLIAENSKKFSTFTSFDIVFQQIPHIASCPVSITFTYKYLTTSTKDIDILIKAMNVIKDYYQDKTTKIKILDFKRYSSNTFYMQWTNCTFEFSSSHLATRGLVEEERQKLTTIFSKVLDQSTSLINPNFKNAFDQHFNLKSVTASFNCIEKGPVPNNNLEINEFARYCRLYERTLPNNLFIDDTDGDIRNMQLTLSYINGNPVSKYEWLQINTENKERQYLYGSVTKEVESAANNRVYRYLITCTDSTGRTATKRLVVTIIPLDRETFHNDFVIGFLNIYDQRTPTAYILATLTRKLTAFVNTVDSSKQIYVKEFNKDSYIRYSYCQLPCTQTVFNTIYSSFQATRYKTEPSLQLKTTMKNEFDVNYVYISAYKCLPTSNIIILKQPCPALTIPTCGYFVRKISASCFYDTSGQSTRDFLLTMLNNDGTVLSPNLSWIQLDLPAQSVYGITVWDEVTSSQTFKLLAQSSVSVKNITNTLQIKVDEYQTKKTLVERVCRVTLEFKNSTHYPKQDMLVMKNIMKMIGNYVSPGDNGDNLLVKSFTRSSSVISITYTNCSWISALQNNIPATTYLNNVLQILHLYFRITESNLVGITASFSQYIENLNYNFVRAYASKGCTTPPNPVTPSNNKDIDIEIKGPCGVFTHKIASDTFFDPTFKDITQLKLRILLENTIDSPSWISVNDNQEIYGLVDKTVIDQQPNKGYHFVLEATNSAETTSTVEVKVLLQPTKWKVEKTITIQMFVLPSGSNTGLKYKVGLIQQIESYPELEPLDSGFFISAFGSGGALVEFKYCKQCDSKYFLLTERIDKKKEPFQAWMKKRFNVMAVTIARPEAETYSKDCFPSSLAAGIIKEMEFCSRNVWYLADDYTEYVELYDVKFVNPDDSPLPISSWVNIMPKPYRVIGYPTESTWKNQPTDGYLYKVILQENGVTVGVPQTFAIKVTGVPKSTGSKYTMVMKTRDSSATRKTDVSYITQTWTKMDALTGTNSSLQHDSFVPYTADTPFSFEISWYNCTSQIVCQGDSSSEEIDFLDNGNSVDGLAIVSSKRQCKDKPPVVKKEYSITIPVCGFFRHRISDTFAIDGKDGSLVNLNVVLQKKDGSPITRDSWIRFNNMRKEIHALPTQSVIDTASIDKTLRYQLAVTDSSGRTSTSILSVRFEEKNTVPYYVYTLGITSKYDTTTPYLEIQQNILTYISGYTGDAISDFQILSFDKIGRMEEYTLRIRNCTVNKYICPVDKQKLDVLSNDLTDNNKEDFKTKILQASGGNIAVGNIVRKSLTKIDPPPTIRKSIPEVMLDYCSQACYTIPDDIFSDAEGSKLEYKLYDNQNNLIQRNSWVNINESKIYIIPLSKIQPITHYFRLRAVDDCQQISPEHVPVTITLSGNQENSPYSIITRFDRKDEEKLAQYLWKINEKVSECSLEKPQKDSSVNGLNITSGIRSEDFQYVTDRIEYQWSNCTLFSKQCKQTEIDKTTASVFSSPNLLRKEFKQCFSNFGLQGAEERRTKECKSKTPPPGVQKQPGFNATFCEKFESSFKPNTFINDQGVGITQNLKLELLNENSEPLPRDEWVQMDPLKRTIYGYPRTGDDYTNIKTKYKYKLRATNAHGASSITDLEINIKGVPVVNFIITLDAELQNINDRPDIDEEIYLMNKLKTVYQQVRINDVQFTRLSGNKIRFKFSFCDFKELCDCDKIRRYASLTETANIKQVTAPTISVSDVSTEKKHKCSNSPKRLSPTPDTDVINVAQCYKIPIPKTSFYDKESLEFSIRSKDGNQFPIDHWLQIDESENSYCGIIPLQTYQTDTKSLDNTQYEYQLVAKDTCENELVIPSKLWLNVTSPTVLNYILTITINRKKGQLMSNCTDIEVLFTKLANYSEVNKTDIIVKEIELFNKTHINATSVSFGYKELSGMNCSNGSLLNYRQRFLVNSTTVNQTFLEYMRPDYQVMAVDDKACELVSSFEVRGGGDDEFPWWILWIFFALALLALFLWLCWLGLPRFCPTCCSSGIPGACCSGWCLECCSPQGKHSSLLNPKNNNVNSDKNDLLPIAGASTDPPGIDNFNRKNDPDEIDIAQPWTIPFIDEDENTGAVISNPYTPTGSFPQVSPTLIDENAIKETSIGGLDAIDSSLNVDSQIRTESYKDKRLDSQLVSSTDAKPSKVLTETYSDSRHVTSSGSRSRQKEHAETFDWLNQNDAYVERIKRYKDRRPSIVYVKDAKSRSERTSALKEGLIKVRSSNKKKQYAISDALVDNPIMLSRESPRDAHQSRRHSEGEVLVRRVRRKSVTSPVRNSTSVINASTVSLRVEKGKHKRKSRSTKGSKGKKATIVYREPSPVRYDKGSHGKKATIVYREPSPVRYDKGSHKRMTYMFPSIENREVARSKHVKMGSLTSESATDPNEYEESLFKPKNDARKKRSIALKYVAQPESDFVKTTSSRHRHTSRNPTSEIKYTTNERRRRYADNSTRDEFFEFGNDNGISNKSKTIHLRKTAYLEKDSIV